MDLRNHSPCHSKACEPFKEDVKIDRVESGTQVEEDDSYCSSLVNYLFLFFDYRDKCWFRSKEGMETSLRMVKEVMGFQVVRENGINIFFQDLTDHCNRDIGR